MLSRSQQLVIIGIREPTAPKHAFTVTRGGPPNVPWSGALEKRRRHGEARRTAFLVCGEKTVETGARTGQDCSVFFLGGAIAAATEEEEQNLSSCSLA